MEIELRLEEEKDYRIVENLTREAFWNHHVPGCDEHFLIHNLRATKEFINELDFVAINNGKIVGNIVYVKSKVINEGYQYRRAEPCTQPDHFPVVRLSAVEPRGIEPFVSSLARSCPCKHGHDLASFGNNGLEHIVLTFGPVSVLPEYQNRGIGSKLINHTINLSKEIGYKGIIIYGDPEYYKRFGFKESKQYKITNKDKKYPATLLVLELYPNALNGIEGIFDEGKAYDIDKNESEEFDKEFPKKDKGYSKTQERFNELVDKYI